MGRRKFVTAFLCIAFACSAYAQKLDVGLGVTWGLQHRVPMLELELEKNGLDFQLDLIGAAIPVRRYDSEHVLVYEGACLYAQGAMSFGYDWKFGESRKHKFGIGLASYTVYDGETDSDAASFWQSFRLYYKYSYTFDFGLEIGVRNFIALAGFYNFKTQSTGKTWNHEWYIFYTDPGPFYELGSIVTLFVPAIEIKYHFK